MTCREFEAIARDLARGRGLDEVPVRNAAAHAAGCAECASLLAAERELTTALEALAAATAGREAPQRIEAVLLSAFDRRSQERAGHRTAPVLWRWTLAAAAAVVLTLAAGAWLMWPRRVEAPVVKVVRPAEPQKVQVAVTPPPVVAPAPQAARRRVHRRAPREVVTRFYPLMPGANGMELGSSAIVRVQMPRAALASFGLPVGQNGAARVVADIALDQDTGMARAIRFVHSQQ
jgi:hypothetical protein